jgi:uncharacterized protein YeeX (DUF496 family)
VEQL